MKYLAKSEALCINCGQCEDVCTTSFFKVKDKEKSCIHIQETTNGNAIKICNQCGVCIDVCPIQAIYRDKNGIVKIKKDICVGCFMCVGFCPEEAMGQHDEYLEPFKCIACGLCAKKCPTEAIFIVEKDDEAKEAKE